MKKLSALLLLCCLALLPLTGCQSGGQDTDQDAQQPAASPLAQLPETKDSVILIEGMEETVSLQKAMHQDFYALYYDPQSLTYAPGEVLEDGSFTDVFLSVYDDETTEVPTTLTISYTPDITPEDWAASVENTQWAPFRAVYDSTFGGTWQATDGTELLSETAFQHWDGTNLFVQNDCYTAPFRNGCLAIAISHPNTTEYAEGWGVRLDAAVHTLVLAAE